MRSAETYQQIAKIHCDAIDQGFLPTLGPGVLALMYRAIDDCDTAVLFTEEVDGTVVGFVTGATGMGPIYKQMLRQFPRLLWALAPSLLNPAKVWRILEILRRNRNSQTDIKVPDYELLSIAVSPNHQRGGTARRLYTQLCDHFRSVGAPGFCIVVGENLDAAHKFYRRLGARQVAETAVHGSSRSLIYVHDL